MITLHWTALAVICFCCAAVGFLTCALLTSASYADEKMDEIFRNEDKRNG